MTTIAACDGTTMDYPTMPQHGELVGNLSVAPGLAMLTEDPKNPGHFKGTANPIHQVSPETGGQSVIDLTVDWDLQRIRRP